MAAQIATRVLQEYADRGVFRGFSPGPVHDGRSAFRLLWHRNREFTVTVDTHRGVIRCPLVLPQVPAHLYAQLKDFVRSRQTDEVPAHRRIDPARAGAATGMRGGNVSVSLTVRDADYGYATRKFVNLIHEIFLVFLPDHFEYQVAAFDLDPDNPI